jgi:hypothetical protein
MAAVKQTDNSGKRGAGGTMQKMHNEAYAYHALIAAVIERAFDDLKGAVPQCGRIDVDRAMYFINSACCEGYCLELGIDYEAARERAAALYQKFL